MSIATLTLQLSGYLTAQPTAQPTARIIGLVIGPTTGLFGGSLAGFVFRVEPGSLGLTAAVSVAAVCPQVPPGAQGPTDQLTGYVLWGVLVLFVMGIVIGLGAVVAGRVFSMPHASRGGVVGLVVVFVAAVAYLVLPSMLDGILGDGCV